MKIREERYDSIGILPAGETNPMILLRQPKHSYEAPVWSHDRERIAFVRADYGNNIDYLGIIRKDGNEQRILLPEFGLIGRPAWSADDRMLGSLKMTRSGMLPFVIDIETEEVVRLLDAPGVDYTYSHFELSPKTMQSIFMGYGVDNPSKLEIWLLSLDGNHKELIPLPPGVTQDCIFSPPPMTWSPDGDAFLVNFTETSSKDCHPTIWDHSRLWLYNLTEKSWTSVRREAEGMPHSIIFWSSSGQWVAWLMADLFLGKQGVSIYSTKDWKLEREIVFEPNWNIDFPINPWVIDNKA